MLELSLCVIEKSILFFLILFNSLIIKIRVRIIFQEKATKWQDNVEIDGLTTNGILIMHPKGQFVGGNTENPGTTPWRECSVGGDVFGLRESRSAQQKGEPVRTISTIIALIIVLKLMIGCLVFLQFPYRFTAKQTFYRTVH